MFVEFAPSYFEYLRQGFPTILCKIVGAYQVNKKCIFVMENLLYGLQMHQQVIYDLKGSQVNRLASPDSFVLLDTNFL